MTNQRPEAYIVEAVRTPVGRRGGGLSTIDPTDLAAHALTAVVERSGIDPGAVDDVILGCIDQMGPQSGDIARTAWLAAGYPEHVPGVTIDRQCGSSQQSVHFAAQAVMSGVDDVVVAGGVQSMSVVPFLSSYYASESMGLPEPFTSPRWVERYGDQEITQFRAAELIADRWDIGRDEMEAFAVTSHERAITATEEGRFEREIAPVGDLARDEGPREPDLGKIRSLPPLREGGRVTAAVSSQISDGAAALLVVSADALERHGLTPRARIHQLAVRGDDPVMMLTAPIAATRHALQRAGMTVDDVDVFEANEAFAPVVMAWERDLGIDHEKVNRNGGAIALGHPIGATGARLMTTLLHELERTDGRFGLQTMCEGGGQANVTIIERL